MLANFTNASDPRGNSTSPTKSGRYEEFIVIIASCFGVMSFFILLGNLLCLVVFLSVEKLRKKPFYLVVSLCFADCLVGVRAFLSMLSLIGYINYWDFYKDLVIAANVLFALSNFASILTLTAISVERFIVIVFPMYHRTAGIYLYVILLGLPWLLAGIFTGMSIARFYVLDTRNLLNDMVAEVSLRLIFVTLSIIIISYTGLFIKVRCSHVQVQCKTQSLRDRRLAVTLLLVTLASMLTWSPFYIYRIYLYYCKTCAVSYKLEYTLDILRYLNSAINIVLYIGRMPEFRKALLSIVRNRTLKPRSKYVTTLRTTRQTALSNLTLEVV